MPDITAVTARADRTLDVTFSDGYQGELQLDNFVHSYTGVFKPLLDPNYFSCVYVNSDLGTLCWPNGADLCPSSVYEHIQSINQQ